MDRDSLNKDGLLEQYLLGLTSREETEAVEKYLASDPEARRDLEFLRSQLGIYLNEHSIPGKAIIASAETPDLEEASEQEAVMHYLIKRNQRLNVLRAILAVVSLILFASTVYYYQQSRRLAADLLTEKARHVQDDNFHEATLRELEHSTVSLDSLHTVVSHSSRGPVQLHYLAADSVILLDLSHLSPPDSGYAYHIHLLENHEERSRYIVSAKQLNALYPISNMTAHLKVIYGAEHAKSSTTPTAPELILSKPLAVVTNTREFPLAEK